jgi:hypothetical protein
MRILEEPHLRELLFQADPDIPLSDKLGSLLGECLAAEGTLCLPGLGTFRMTNGRLCFEPWTRKRVFLAYVKEDIARVKSLYRYLKRQGFDPWMDVYRLLPGQDWPRAIERAISLSRASREPRVHAAAISIASCATHWSVLNTFHWKLPTWCPFVWNRAKYLSVCSDRFSIWTCFQTSTRACASC